MTTISAVIITALCAFLGFWFLGFNGAILLAVISGVGCIVEAINEKREASEQKTDTEKNNPSETKKPTDMEKE